MPKVPLYSRSSRGTGAPLPSRAATGGASTGAQAPAEPAPAPPPKPARRALPHWLRSPLPWIATSIALAVLLGQMLVRTPAQPPLTQERIDRAVLSTLETKTLPSPAARAYAAVAKSIVLVEGERGDDAAGKDDTERMVGTGVVIVDSGVILTNLHVVLGADKLHLRFADGTPPTPASTAGAAPTASTASPAPAPRAGRARPARRASTTARSTLASTAGPARTPTSASPAPAPPAGRGPPARRPPPGRPASRCAKRA